MLIVIFVLGVGILSIAVLITKNLSLVKNIHTQNTATILAREGIEMVSNIRDTNILLWYRRNCAQRATLSQISSAINWSDICQKYMRTWDNSSHYFVVEWWLSSQRQISLSSITGMSFDELFWQSKLYLTGITTPVSISWYTHIWWGESMFARYISFTKMVWLPSWWPITNSDIHRITSTVLYRLSDNTTGQVSLESFITNTD
jgi:hypothetical protein